MNKLKCLSGSTLKWVALCAMLIDHIGAVFREYLVPAHSGLYLCMRSVGRIAFPIFAFLLVEGFIHTKNVYRYLFSLILFALISEIPANYAFFGKITAEWCNIYFTLALGLLMLIVIREFETHKYKWLLSIVVLIFFCCVAYWLRCDYNQTGIALIFVFYMFRKDLLLWGIGSFALFVTSPARMLSYPFLLLYNGKRGRQVKYVFYIFYPLHLAVLLLIRMVLKGGL